MAHTELHLGSTYGFAPAACAGAQAGIELIEGGGVLDNALALERIFKQVLEPLRREVEQVGDVRAVGAMAAVEFVSDKASNQPAPAFQYAVHHASLRRGVLGISQRGKWHYRLQPALTMPPEVFRHSCEQIAEAIREVARLPPPERSDVQDAVAAALR